MPMGLYKISGIVAFAVAWFGMLLAVFSQGKDKSKSISLHAAASKKTIVLLAVLSPISMLLFMVFVIKWIAPIFNLPSAFVGLNILAFTGYILAAWIPAINGMREKLHNIFAFGASLLLIPITIIVVTSSNIHLVTRLINALAILIMVSVFAIMFWHKPAKASYLYFQIAYFLAFDIGLLAVGYLR